MAALLLGGSLTAVQAANELIIASFQDGYLSWTNGNTNLYYTVEYKPNLADTNLVWDGSYRAAQDLKSSAASITAPVGVYYQVVGSSNPLHTLAFSATTTAVHAGYYEAATLNTVDADLVAGNIRSGINIFGVNGNSNVVDTASGNAGAGDIKAGQVAWVNGLAVTGAIATLTFSSATTNVPAGYYAATNLPAVDADLKADNIATNVTIFGIAGTLSTTPAAVPKTGQTNSYQTWDDGFHKKGVVWPNPRFTVQANTNCVLDNLTGLVWARNASLVGTMTWTDAVFYCWALDNITNVLYTYGGTNDWRLPNRRELLSLIDDGRINPALCDTTGTVSWTENNPFTGVKSDNFYWSSTTYAGVTDDAWAVFVGGGGVWLRPKTDAYYVWLVRGGQ